MKELQTSFKNGKVITGADAVIERFSIACLMALGEFSPTPGEGIGLGDLVDEPNTNRTIGNVKTQIKGLVRKRFPEIKILDLSVTAPALNQLAIELRAFVIPAGQERTTKIEFMGVR